MSLSHEARRKMRKCSALLPEPGGEVVCGLLDELDKLAPALGPREREYLVYAEEHLTTDTLEFDELPSVCMGPSVDRSGEDGAWVRGWVWVSRADLPSKEDEGV